ncbi:FAD-dependent oxidoreductase [Oceanobacillus neutriphilus]|uniref:FAD-dependent oxidoreductase n=1 Tax=Oceanobacillus neutriphilus TaxID=531815 RepID=A0ABQ2NTL6_9BACI|nr:FAD-dependent oxidoreductase [Oceanobacillus neutriphilus]GGP08619.1 FAD-dependent oxidoreductase [Oceanobacillus neutriphilus]
MNKKTNIFQHSTKTNEASTTSVIVVGGSLVGLSTAMFLAKQGVSTILVERHPGSSAHPRATGFTPRTMELFRTVGIAEQIPQAPTKFRLRRARVESLAGEWFEESEWTPGKQQLPDIEYSPYRGAAIAQDRLEPILRDKAIELGAEVRMNTELISFEQDSTGVTAFLRSREDENEYTLRADYLVAADGNRSPIREKLGIGRNGHGHIRTMRSVLFRAPLEKYLASGIRQFNIDQPGLKAFLTTYGDGRWVLMFNDDKERDEEELLHAVQNAIGRPDLNIEIITTGRWKLSALIADKFSSGRIFLAGDAAHTLPPTRGGFGANTGIEDAYNLAWKLSAVLSGESSTEILDTYDAERRPIAWLRHDQTFARPDYKSNVDDTENDVIIIDDDAMEFGQLYRSKAIIGTDTKLSPALRIEQWAGQPGTRAPHLWANKNGEKITTLDLFECGWVLLTEDERWITLAESVGEQLGVKLKCCQVGTDVVMSDPEVFREAFGLGHTGATLVRPDGYIAWRSADMPENPHCTLTKAVELVSSSVARALEK